MAPPTRPRGPGDTWAPLLPRLSRSSLLALTVALLLHLPLCPMPAMQWLRTLIFGHVGDYDDVDAGAFVPFDLDLLADPVAAPVQPSPPKPAPTPEELPDAGALPRPPPPVPDAGPPPVADAGAPPLVDPTSAAGPAGKIAADSPNVQILVAGKVLRRHELGPWGSRMLRMVPDWKAFFEGSPVDPIQDLDHLLITAPRLKDDSSKLVAVLEHHLSRDVAREAVDRVLRRTNGVWLEDAPVTVARAVVGGAPRLFALLPDRHLLVVLPAEAMDQLPRLKRAKGFRNSAEGAVISLRTPARPFEGFLPLPQSLRWLRLALTPSADGGVDLAIEAGDASRDEAAAHAEVLTREIEARRKVDLLGMASYEIVDAVRFAADGAVIKARTHLTAPKMRMIMGWVEGKARERYGVK